MRHQRRGDVIVRLVFALAAGVVYQYAFAPYLIWPLAVPALAMIAWAVLGRGFWFGALSGALFGVGFWTGHIIWLTEYLGAVPWIALSAAMTAFCALGCAIGGFLTRRRLMRQTHPALIALVWAIVWTAREAVFSRMPYGGFAWGEAAHSQSNAPTIGLSSWLGLAGLTLALVFVSALPVTWMLSRRPVRRPLVVGVVLLVLGMLVPAWGAIVPAQGSVRIAAVQGNANAGLFSNAQPGEILANHLAAARQIMHDDFDVMVWPENAVDLDVLRNRQAHAQIEAFVDEMGRPLVLGSVTKRGDDFYNSVVLWMPKGMSAPAGLTDERDDGAAEPAVSGVDPTTTSGGPVQIYDKKHPVPFAEYMPDRWLFHPIAPDLVDLVPRGYTFGQRTGNFQIPSGDTANDAVNAGVLICFETGDSDLVHAAVAGGAQLLLAPTNNADFGQTAESAQQMAIARANAVAAARSLVNISTVSSSAVIAPDGAFIDRLPDFEPGTMVQDVPLQGSLAPGFFAGPVITWGSVAATVLMIVGEVVTRRRDRRLGQQITARSGRI
ncbi:apolipoprotein N-acyltransferase [Pseudoclavibacter sp. 13-3]|uniref:apolipoprotein N-acyltransferase n=1 Tax=Pseudoclavibacter sp. 13-3 TaxID=2901228 RepID=UPI001E45D99E|nr:apolipoprotein N-acyltransferase [Pseudoclavibacter sp. 13-3]MCD7101889.1 apolipoprotein N-acyltransferase [Pseudoclavibacter sp. 13-3]